MVRAAGPAEVQVIAEGCFLDGLGRKFMMFLSIVLTILIGLQLTEMIQSDRLYARLNRIVGAQQFGAPRARTDHAGTSGRPETDIGPVEYEASAGVTEEGD